MFAECHQAPAKPGWKRRGRQDVYVSSGSWQSQDSTEGSMHGIWERSPQLALASMLRIKRPTGCQPPCSSASPGSFGAPVAIKDGQPGVAMTSMPRLCLRSKLIAASTKFARQDRGCIANIRSNAASLSNHVTRSAVASSHVLAHRAGASRSRAKPRLIECRRFGAGPAKRQGGNPPHEPGSSVIARRRPRYV